MKAFRIIPALGFDVGASLAVAQAAAHHTIDPQLFACDLALGHAIYGRDRLLDQLDDGAELTGAARALKVSTSLACVASCYLLLHHGNLEMAPTSALLSLGYRGVKKYMCCFKPAIIGLLWAVAIVYLPADRVMNEPALLPFYALLYASASSTADIRDIAEDKKNGLRTLPVVAGKEASYVVSGVLAACAMAVHTTVVEWTAGDYFVELVAAAILTACGVNIVRGY